MRKTLQVFLACTLLLLLLPPAIQAQDRTLSGTIVAEESKTPLTGVTIRVKGTRRMTLTDANGKFSLKVSVGEVLQISYVGYNTTEIKVGSTETVGISLKSADKAMDEVVVTAMDIKRSPRSLGYSTQSIKGDDIQETQRENFVNGLQGRVAGLTLDPTSGLAGASSNIVLRGYNSLSLSNSPLFVVDGIVMDNSSLNETSSGGATNGLASDKPNVKSDYQNRIADLNPNDIESVTVLKGPEATALYGSQASSGAIIITTKKSKTNKLGIQYDNSFRIQEVTRFPDVLNTFSNGTNGNSSSSFYRYGPQYAPGTQLYNNIENFFRTGTAQTHNLGMDFGLGESKFRLSGTYFDQKGVVPNNDFNRYNFRISNTTKFLKGKVDFTPSFAYTKSTNNKVLRSAGGFLMSLLLWPKTNDIRKYENDLTGDKNELFEGGDAPNSEYDNPLWNVYNNFGKDEVARKTYSLGVNINPYKWLILSGRFGYDTYNQNGYLFQHPQSYYLGADKGGALDNYWRKYEGYNHTITATIRKDVAKNLNVKLMGGTMWQDYKTSMWAVYGTNIVDSVGTSFVANPTGFGKMYKNGSLVTTKDLNTILGNYMDSNVTRVNTRLRLNRNKFGEWNYVSSRQIAYFGEFAVSFKNLLFFNYTHRFEQASTLPKLNRQYNYPGGSLSLILSDLFPSIKKGGAVNYWKLRTSRATTARLNSPYSTQSVFVDNLASGGGYSYGYFNNAQDLVPEKQNTQEFGTEIRFLNNKFSIDFTYYNTLNKDQIIENFRLSYGTGFVLNTQNAGSTRNKGVEIVLDYTAIKQKDFSWDMRFNFNKMHSKVVKLPKNISEYYLSDTYSIYSARGGVVFGGSTTSLTGSTYKRNAAGQILINPANGLPIIDATYRVIADRNPDFTLGWMNNFKYKNWRLSVLWDIRVGGDIFNGTNRFMTQMGISQKTADRYTPRVIQGVLEDGLQNSSFPTVNTISVIPAYQYTYYTLPDEEFIEKNVNAVRLRDITLSYTFKKNLIKGFKSLGAFVTGNDLVLLTNYSGADPSVNGNTAGSRGVGAFGYDYGTLAAPMQVNFGIKASF